MEEAKPRLQMAFLGQTEERASRFPGVGLLVLIMDHRYAGWESVMALNLAEIGTVEGQVYKNSV